MGDGTKIMGYAALEPGAELTPIFYSLPLLKGNEVRIAVSHCGLCGSDIQAIDDVYSVFDFPFVPGHEVVGHISEVGEQVPESRIGERVGVGWQARACGKCKWCLRGDVHLCMETEKNGTWVPYGGFSSSITVQQDFAYPLPDEMPSEAAAVMMCAGFTVYTALSRHFTAPSQRIGILGIGGLGHLAIQFAKAMGYEVTAISSSPRKEKESLLLGAERFLNVSDRESLRQMAYYFDSILITSQGGIPWERMLEILKKKGKLILAAFPHVDFTPVDMVVHELSMVSAFLGRREEMREMLQFAVLHNIQPMIELMKMSKVNQAIERLKHNIARYRIVLVNDIT